MQNFIDLVTVTGSIIAALSPVILEVIGYIRPKKKNGNLQLLNTWSEQAVNFVENSELGSTAKKQQAIHFVSQRLAANGLLKKFSPEQIDATIEMAVAKLNSIQLNK